MCIIFVMYHVPCGVSNIVVFVLCLVMEFTEIAADRSHVSACYKQMTDKINFLINTLEKKKTKNPNRPGVARGCWGPYINPLCILLNTVRSVLIIY